MKILTFLLLPALVFASNPDYPDTIFMKNGVRYSCFITQIDTNAGTIRIINKEKKKTAALLNMIKEAYLNGDILIYSSENGFQKEIAILNSLLTEREINRNKINETETVKQVDEVKEEIKKITEAKKVNSGIRPGFGMVFTAPMEQSSIEVDIPLACFPVNIQDQILAEMDIGLLREKSSDNDNYETTRTRFQIEFGLFGIYRKQWAVFHYGVRVGYFNYTLKYDYDNGYYPEGYNSEEKIRTKIQRSIGPCLGGEYFWNKNFTIGLEVGYIYTSKKFEDEFDYYSEDKYGSLQKIRNRLFFRFYF